MNNNDSIWVSIGKTILQLFINKVDEKKGKLATTTVNIKIPLDAPEEAVKNESVLPPNTSNIDWTNPGQRVSKYFTVHEMLYLPTWKRLANESDGLNEEIKTNLIKLGQKLDTVREYFAKPINVHVTYRPLEYNKAIGGALHSMHSEGGAMDFDIMGLTCDQVRDELVNKGLLEMWGLRCEKTPGSNWVHLDYKEVPEGGNRYFIP